MDRFEDDVSLELARAAHRGTSHVPDERGDQERARYAATLESDLGELARIAGDDPEKLATLSAEFPRYHEGFKRRTLAWLRSRAACLSVMVTGPSNFPTRRNEKRNRIADRRMADLTEYRTRALAAIRRALSPESAPIMSGDSDAVERLRAKLAAAEKRQAAMIAANAEIRKHASQGADAQVAALVALGHSAWIARELLKPDFMGRVGFPDWETRNNGANVRRMRERLEGLERAKAAPTVETIGERARLEDCPADNRIRIFYPGKPASEVRQRLKRGGFRWAPSLGCWQAYRNTGTLAFAASEARS